jgi:predicted dehydrogenase
MGFSTWELQSSNDAIRNTRHSLDRRNRHSCDPADLPRDSAIASRDESKAKTMAKRFDVDSTEGSYAALLERTDIDAVYNPLPNALHAE